MNNAEKVNVTILEEWIAGRGKNPVSWKTLIKTLRNTGLNVLAGEIEAVKSYSKAQLRELYSYRNMQSCMLQKNQDLITEKLI